MGTWHYQAEATVYPQADAVYDAVYADFTHLLNSTFHTFGALDKSSIRVVLLQGGKPGVLVAYGFEKAADYNAASNAAGILISEVAATKDPATVNYRVCFDT